MIAIAASGAMAVTMPVCAAFAADGGATADGVAAGSPGAISGNTVQLPVSVPVNVCGNTVNVVGLLNPAAGNTCANVSGDKDARSGGHVRSGARTRATDTHTRATDTHTRSGSHTRGGAHARGVEEGSPGVISGNGVQLPVDLPVNVSGNSVSVVGVLNPALGNTSVNTSGHDEPAPVREVPRHPVQHPSAPASPRTIPASPVTPDQQAPEAPAATLAHTGADLTLPAAAGSAALVLAGAILMRRARPQSGR
ncbi:hypothetical protein WN71_033800 [Streptomyces mangrovisoli]|uniref:Chaplin domain-containing protein n=1 Tax=Streptomyces mangrovisoli TaxID=1428628 RepID=A0A1J4NQS0_9ACTN|nr:chaplin [Streptomyces mangrovisoli]OIJ63486.1 hypothetical protein WN71_033800 [Streptomyces mangrovisoli]